MIYEEVPEGQPIRQGDIFVDLPMPVLDLAKLSIVPDEPVEEYIHGNWEQLRATVGDDGMMAVMPILKVRAIVITQDCEAVRKDSISLCIIDDFEVIHKGVAQDMEKKTAKTWKDHIIKDTKVSPSWFYLPTDSRYCIEKRAAVDFGALFSLLRVDLLALTKSHRVGRLNETAYQHFRERLAEYFRRLAFQEWYPLTKAEFEAYVAGHQAGADIPPFDWQK